MKERLLKYLKSKRHYSWTVSVLPGLYALIYLYKNNYYLVNSIDQFMGLGVWFVIVPFIGITLLHLLVKKYALKKLDQLYFSYLLIYSAAIISLITFMNWRWKGLLLVALVVIIASFYFAKHYKKVVILLGFMTLIVSAQFSWYYLSDVTDKKNWVKKMNFEQSVFIQKPNIYLIQPDGYAGKMGIDSKYYDVNNDAFYEQMAELDYEFNHDYRSNYTATLSSNSALFTAQHHYLETQEPKGELADARNIILGHNPVLNTFHKNGYQTQFISGTTYLQTNFPEVAYGYSNITKQVLPYFPFFKSGIDVVEELGIQLEKQNITTEKTPTFTFIEFLEPGHITSLQSQSIGKEAEAKAYIDRLKSTHQKIKDLSFLITSKDPDAIIIIAADHGGFVGMDYTGEIHDGILTADTHLKHSAFNSLFTYRAPHDFQLYANHIHSSVSLFPNLFAFLTGQPPVSNMDNSSYVQVIEDGKIFVMRYFDNEGNTVDERID